MDRETALAVMRRVLSMTGQPPADQWDEVAALFQRKSLDKGEHFLQAGVRSSVFGFVASGLLRMYYLRRDGKEFNKSFIRAHDFTGATDSMLSGEETRISIQALEPSILLVADYRAFAPYYERHMFWQRLGRLFAEGLYLKKVRREAAFLMDSAGERYDAFRAEYGDIENRIPDYHIAAYLGITPESLSRLKRAKLRGP